MATTAHSTVEAEIPAISAAAQAAPQTLRAAYPYAPILAPPGLPQYVAVGPPGVLPPSSSMPFSHPHRDPYQSMRFATHAGGPIYGYAPMPLPMYHHHPGLLPPSYLHPAHLAHFHPAIPPPPHGGYAPSEYASAARLSALAAHAAARDAPAAAFAAHAAAANAPAAALAAHAAVSAAAAAVSDPARPSGAPPFLQRRPARWHQSEPRTMPPRATTPPFETSPHDAAASAWVPPQPRDVAPMPRNAYAYDQHGKPIYGKRAWTPAEDDQVCALPPSPRSHAISPEIMSEPRACLHPQP